MEKEKRLQLLQELLDKLTDAYYDAEEIDDDCASAISAAENTVISAIDYWKGK